MPHKQPWPHAPLHRLELPGAYIVTSATYKQTHLFDTRSKLDQLQQTLFAAAASHQVALQAWCLFPNHYHFVAQFSDPTRLSAMAREFHSLSARALNVRDNARGRRVWYQYWETLLTNDRAYFARLHYTHRNCVHHGVARSAVLYPWCSAAWFESEAPVSFQKVVYSMPCDRISIDDGFTVCAPKADEE